MKLKFGWHQRGEQYHIVIKGIPGGTHKASGKCYITLCPRKDYNYIDYLNEKTWVYPGLNCSKELTYDLLCKNCINLYTEKYVGELKFEMIKLKLGVK